MSHIRIRVIILAIFLSICPRFFCAAEMRGPASTYAELRRLLAEADELDTILVSGKLVADSSVPLSSEANVRIMSTDDSYATISGMRLLDASISFYHVSFENSLHIEGTSHIQLNSGVCVSGAAGQAGLSFSGNGTLIIDRSCSISGGKEGAGISIEHTGGDFYSSVEGHVSGGDGKNGGVGLIISPLTSAGAVMVSGLIEGGDGTAHGGHALNLYQLDGNAYVTVEGDLEGGKGSIGGDGIQLVAAHDNVNVRIGGTVRGGQGSSHGGDALILMNTEDASSFHLSGSFAGGNAIAANAQPGTSLQLVGDSASTRTRVVDCILEEGKTLFFTPEPEAPQPTPDVTILPEITSSIDDLRELFTPEPAGSSLPENSDTPSPESDSSDVLSEISPPAQTVENEATPSEAS